MDLGLIKDIGIFLAGLMVGPVVYFAKRKIERRPEHEDLEIKERLLKINRELNDQNLTPDDLKQLDTILFAKLKGRISVGEAEHRVALITHSASSRPITQTEMNQASYDEAEKANLKLQQALRRLSAVLSPENAKRLEETQTAWHAFREKQIVLAGSFYGGGSMQLLIHNVEAQALTEARAKELRSLYEELTSR